MPEERPRDYDSMRGKSEGVLYTAALDDMVSFPKIMFRLVTLPIWLPYRVWKIIRGRRDMAEFARMRARNVILNDRVVREITLDWVKDHPDDYVLGEYDPKVMKLQRTFGKLLGRRK